MNPVYAYAAQQPPASRNGVVTMATMTMQETETRDVEGQNVNEQVVGQKDSGGENVREGQQQPPGEENISSEQTDL